MRRFVAAFLVATAALAGTAVGAPPNPPSAPKEKPREKEQDLVVGVAGPMSGPFGFIGEQMKRGAQQAIDDINAKGGVLGKKLKLAVGDDGCDEKLAATVANTFVQQKAVLVVGHFCSGASIQAASAYAQAGIPEITPASSDPKLTDDAASKGWTNVFNIAGRADVQGGVAGDYIASKYKGKKVAVIDDKSSYGKALAEEARKAMNKKGLKEALSAEIAQGDKDFSALIGKLKQAGVAAVYFGGYQAEAGLLVRQAQDQGLKAQFIAGDALVTDEFWKASGHFSFFLPFPEGIVFATSFYGGVIAPIGGTQEIPISLREFAGGTNSVRGFKFQGVGPKVDGNPTGGEVSLTLQSEVRFPIYGNLQGAFFSDQGGVWFDRTRVNLTETRYSLGAGLRFITPAGAIVADLGWNPHVKQGEYPVEFHLSVGFPF